MMAGFLLMIFFFFFFPAADSSYESILGDKEMKNTDARFALEAWNACNQVGEESTQPGMGSPRMADCADVNCTKQGSGSRLSCNVIQRVKDSDNSLKAGDSFPNGTFNSVADVADVDNYAVEKEKYLGSLCERTDNNITSYFWKIMVKNVNLDPNSGKCPEYGTKVNHVNQTLWANEFPCFGKGCMKQPLMYRNPSRLVVLDNISSPSLKGGFYGTYDVNDDTLSSNGTKIGVDNSYFAVKWLKNNETSTNKNKNQWMMSFTLQTSANYPWLKLLLRADAANGTNAGYPHDGRGIMKASLLLQGNFTVRFALAIKIGGGVGSQFYLTEIGGCLKNNGNSCDGNVTTDVTRYVQMIINPDTTSVCGYNNQAACPPYHINSTGHKIYKNDSANFPFSAYHLYCAPGNAKHLEEPINKCDPYTNPNAQELIQFLPHPEWAAYGYPSSTNDVGWEEYSVKTWELDAGRLLHSLYFYQDLDAASATKPKPPIVWTSINVGTEMYYLNSTAAARQTAKWIIFDFDVVVPKSK